MVAMRSQDASESRPVASELRSDVGEVRGSRGCHASVIRGASTPLTPRSSLFAHIAMPISAMTVLGWVVVRHGALGSVPPAVSGSTT